MTDAEGEAQHAAENDLASRLLERLADQVGGKAGAKAVFGDSVERDGITVIPVARVRWGVGAGGGAGPEGSGSGGGGGVRSMGSHRPRFSWPGDMIAQTRWSRLLSVRLARPLQESASRNRLEWVSEHSRG